MLGWCGFSNNGFLNGDEISEGDTLDAYVLSENEPFATLFKKGTLFKKIFFIVKKYFLFFFALYVVLDK